MLFDSCIYFDVMREFFLKVPVFSYRNVHLFTAQLSEKLSFPLESAKPVSFFLPPSEKLLTGDMKKGGNTGRRVIKETPGCSG